MSRITSPYSLAVRLTLLACLVCPLAAASAEELAFRRHVLNADSTYSACAAVDVDRDGKLDVAAGGFWYRYQAPDWQRHKLRDVEEIRGRYDDYSNLPYDVNGDGWTDLISANYRSQTLYWIEHPGKSLGEWNARVIEKPGPMETGRLADVDGDGRLDILPNGVKFAAWWEIVPAGQGSPTVSFRRHELPIEIAAHGLGIGDLNGDGRDDLICPRGWLEAPEDRRKGRWLWHPDFRLHRDCGLPILAMDVDADGDNDIVYARGHNFGLYWLEQQTGRDGPPRWQLHAIDTSWSQLHALLVGDLDGDGRNEVVAGKRYMAHDGRDPGAFDPLMVCAYDYQPESRSWRRRVISRGWQVGFGLDPKLVDLDGDQDLDLICPGRSGLYWLENLRVGPGPATSVELETPDYDDHTQLLSYRAGGEAHPIDERAKWNIRREHILHGMRQVLGDLPPATQRVPLDVKIESETATDAGYLRRKVTFTPEPGDRVPAWLLIPRELDGPAPAMLCLHQTIKIGKDEPAGLGGSPGLHYAHELASRGYVCIVPDYPGFGEYKYDFAAHRDRYSSGSMKAVWNNIRAVDLLESLPEVDPDRMGCIGHSLGGHNALFTAAIDQRLHAVVTSCGFTGFHDYRGGKLAAWSQDLYMPRIRDQYQNDPDRVPFDFYEVVAALAPRAMFTNSPVRDSNFDVDGVRKVIDQAAAVYQLTGAADRLQAVYPEAGHSFPDDIRRQAYEWLDRQLK